MLKNKKSLLLFLIIFLFAGCGSGSGPVKPSDEADLKENKSQNNQVYEFSGKIIINDGQASTTKDFYIFKGASIFDLMKKMQDDGELSMQYKDSSAGAFIESINGIENDIKKNKYWMLYINDELATSGVSDLKITTDDVVEWKFIDTSNIF